MAMNRFVHGVVGLAAVSAVALGCSTVNDSVAAARRTTQSAAAEPMASASKGGDPRWACSPKRRVAFFTDPIIYDRGVRLRRIASQAVDHASFEIEREGLTADVTFLDPRGLIRHRFEYIRGKTRGWSLERGQSCRAAQ
jgi:hypothetical protein